MKKKDGCLKRLLLLVIFAGILAAIALFAIGYNKANEAAAAKTPVEELYTGYVGDNSLGLSVDNNFVDIVIDSAVDKDSFYGRCLSLFGDHTIANLLVKKVYLPDDDLISTTIAQTILTYRIEKAYDDKDILLIYCYAMGYGAGDITTVENLLHNEDGTSLTDLVTIDSSFVNDILDYLTKAGYLSKENAATITEHLTNQ